MISSIIQRADDVKTGFHGDNIRVLRFSWGGWHSGGYADAPPPATTTRAKALGIQPFRLDTFARKIIATYNRSTIMVMPITAATPPFNCNEVAE